MELIAKYVSDGLACVVEVERGNAKVGGSDQTATLSLRVTSVFRLEHDVWKLVHRHADKSSRSAARVRSPEAIERLVGHQERPGHRRYEATRASTEW